MTDDNCHYFTLTGNPNLPSRCLAPLRYQGRDLKNSPDDFSCGSDNYQKCPWNPQKKGLTKLLSDK